MKKILLAILLAMPLYADLYHVVICWLKDSSTKQQLIKTTKELEKIEGVESIQIGSMLPSKRKIVDSSYDMGIIFHFKDEKAMQGYLSNPLHQKALKETLIPLSSKVIVYDFKSVEQ